MWGCVYKTEVILCRDISWPDDRVIICCRDMLILCEDLKKAVRLQRCDAQCRVTTLVGAVSINFYFNYFTTCTVHLLLFAQWAMVGLCA